MKYVHGITLLLLTYGLSAGAVCSDLARPYMVYYGASDSSAAVSLGSDTFVVADDENNVLRIYKTSNGPLPIALCDLTEFIAADPEYPEADIEGAAMIDDRIYWITSHGRNKDGKMRPNRYRFFATSVKMENNTPVIKPVGKPCRTLVHEMIKSETTRPLKLDTVTRFDENKLKKKEREMLAPKEKGLNIEGLCAAPDGNTLYIGLRNPQIPDAAGWQMAVIVPLLNPKQIIEKEASPIFGNPILLDLNGLGIRSMEYSRFHKSYFIIAGPKNHGPAPALYRWSGKEKEKPLLIKTFSSDDDFTPEALIIFEDSGRLLVLSDDGDIDVDVSAKSECMKGKLSENGKCPNKYLSDQNKKHFRSIWLDL